MKLHWSPRSPFVRKVMVAAHELSLVDRIECVRSVAAMSAPNPAIMRDNPLSKIPTLVLDDGRALFDSDVIIDYLDELGGGHLSPPPGADRWRALTRAALCSGWLDILILWRNERDKPEPRRTPEWLDAFAAKTDATLAWLEADVEEAAPFDLSHVGLGCALSYLDFRFSDLGWRDGHPRLARWHAGFCERPSARATAIVDA